MTIELLIVMLAFAGGFLMVFAANLVVTDIRYTERREEQRLALEQLRLEQKELARNSPLVSRGLASGDLAEMAAEAFEEVSQEDMSLTQRLQTMLQQAGMRIRVEKLLGLMLASAVGTGTLTGALSGNVVLSVVAGLAVGVIPLIVVQAKRQRRLELLRSQLPDSFDLMARILRAGQTISQGMHSVSQEFSPPIAIEFGYCYEQQNLGLNPELALRDLARRTGLLEIKIFVLSVLVHRQTGGNLTELLEKLSTIVRDRYRLRAKIKAVTAEGRLQGLILLMLPVFVYAILLVTNRVYALKLFDHPWLPITTVLMMGIGALWIRKIINFDY